MKLHELLAVETNLENQANKTRTELTATFASKRHLFEEKRSTFQSNEEGAAPVTETQSDLQTTVHKELDWIKAHIRKSLDASYQVAEANTSARADIILEDTEEPLLKALPATALLELEKRIADVTQLIMAIPTLDPAKGFVPDTEKGAGTYKAREVVKNRTKKAIKVLVLMQPTKEHPGQAQTVTEDVPTGVIREQEWSGLITPAEKAELINRAEVMQRAVRRARSRANEAIVDDKKRIGDKILTYIFGS